MSGKVGASDTRAIVVSEICGRLIAGESVAAIFREPGDRYPHFTTFWRWLRDNPEFDSQVSEAQLAGCRALEDRLLDVSREERVGEIVTEKPTGTERKRADMVDRSRLEADSIKWVLARRYPKRYGDRTTIAGDADNPLAIVDQSSIASRLLPELAASGTPAPPSSSDTDRDGES